MKRKILGLILAVLIIITSVLIFRVLVETTPEPSDEEQQDHLEEDILTEIDGSLLGEDDEIEIGEMV